MKILGSVALIIGLLITIIGIGEAGSISCNCPIAQDGKASPQQQIGLIVEYVGIAISLGGAGVILMSVVKKSSRKVLE